MNATNETNSTSDSADAESVDSKSNFQDFYKYYSKNDSTIHKKHGNNLYFSNSDYNNDKYFGL